MTNLTVDNLTVNGTLRAAAIPIPNGSVGGAAFDVTNPGPVGAVIQQLLKGFNQDHATSAGTFRQVIHVARNAGIFAAALAGVTIANIGAATITIDILKNGTTALSATIGLSSSQAAFATVAGTPSAGGNYIAGDVFEVSISASAGGGTIGKGLFIQGVFNEVGS